MKVLTLHILKTFGKMEFIVPSVKEIQMDTNDPEQTVLSSKEQGMTHLDTNVGENDNMLLGNTALHMEQDLFDVNVGIDHEEVISETSSVMTERMPVRKNKSMRMHGEKYFGVKQNEDGKRNYNIEQPERVMHPRNCTARCDKSWGGRKCSQIDEQTRSEIFNTFWKNMTWGEKKVYVSSLVKKKIVSRRTTVNKDSRRNHSYTYYLRKGKSTYVVCKALFWATLSLKEDTVYN